MDASTHREAETTERDPVCGMSVEIATAQHRLTHDHTDYAFCSAHCLDRFQADPEKFLNPVPADSQADPGAIYICPMHPKVRQVGPGDCPDCGMALEPEDITAETGPNPEHVDFTRRFWVGAVLGVPLVVLAMGAHLPFFSLSDIIPHNVNHWIQIVLATPIVLWCGLPFFKRGWTSVVNRSLNMFTLIAIGTGVAYIYSVVATVAPGLFPDTFRSATQTVDVYFEAAGVIVVLVLLGQLMELQARDRTGSAIRSLMKLAPDTATVIRESGAEETVPLETIAVGDRLRIRPGEKVPIDGHVVDGSSNVDEAMVTGEAVPVAKAPGDAVIGGTLNTTGSFVMVADHVGGDTMLARIVQLVAQAQRSRAPIQRIADTVAGYFVPAVIAVAVIAFVIWWAVGPAPSLAHAMIAAVSVLIIACPCALGLATPMSITVGVARGAQAGVLIRDAEALEGLEKIDTLVLDKTGTLTEGKPAVVHIDPAEGYDESRILTIAASLEQHSEHPLATAIVGAARDRGLTLTAPTDFNAQSGKGITGLLDGRRITVGSEKLLEDQTRSAQWTERADAARRNGATVVFVIEADRIAGAIAIADPIKATTPAALDALRKDGLRIVMLTGDHELVAQSVADRLSIDEVHANVLPSEKGDQIRRLRDEGRRVAMAGDGVNDAPALAEADIGIAMGTGTDVAIESANVTLVKGDLTGIVRARQLSTATMRNIRQNLFLAFVYNSVGVPIAAGILYPLTGLLLSPVIAAAAMSLSSVSVIGNALRLRTLSLR
jgi:Cu+-exporting ATPase